MPFYSYSQPRRRSRLKPGHPLARGITHCWLFVTPGPGVRDLMHPSWTASLNYTSGCSFTGYSLGQGLRMTGAVGFGVSSAGALAKGFTISSGPFTMRLMGTRITSQTGGCPLLYKSDNNVNTGVWMDIRESAAAHQIGFSIVCAAVNAKYYAATAPDVGSRFHLTCTWNGSTGALGGKVFIGATESASYSSDRIGGTGAHVGDAIDEPCLFGTSSAGPTNVGVIFTWESLTVWNRALSPNEVRQLAEKPYAFLV